MNQVKFGKRIVQTQEPPTPWWSSMSSLIYIAINFVLIYVFLIWPVQTGASLTLRGIIIWLVLTAFAALLFLWVRRMKIANTEKK